MRSILLTLFTNNFAQSPLASAVGCSATTFRWREYFFLARLVAIFDFIMLEYLRQYKQSKNVYLRV